MHVFTQIRKLIGTKSALVLLLAAAILTNLLQLDLVPRGGRFRPLPYFETADITKIAEEKSQDLKARYALFFEVGRKYPTSTIVLQHSDQPVDPLAVHFLSYGRAGSIVWAKYSPDAVLSNFGYESFIVAKGTLAEKWKGNKRLVPFAIAAGFSPNVFLFLRQRDKVVLVDLALLFKARARPHD